MIRAALAGGLYFLAVFAVGFVLGTIRTLLLVPRLGELAAVLLELPLMLAASWLLCGAVTRRLTIRPRVPLRLVMGGTGLALLMTAEFALGTFGFGRSMAQQLALLAQPPGALGLAGQIAFGLIPALRR